MLRYERKEPKSSILFESQLLKKKTSVKLSPHLVQMIEQLRRGTVKDVIIKDRLILELGEEWSIKCAGRGINYDGKLHVRKREGQKCRPIAAKNNL